MALASGTKLGSYEIRSPLGAGGMGEVYRASDPKLKRDVALKVLPEAFARDEQRMARFEREAQLLASLNHPNIGAIYGLEEWDGTRALVMELVDGPTIADRLKQGAIPIDEALPIAKQIAEALEYAHDHGIIHRDLKPANIKIKSDGTVKVLDFGLAKALADDPAAQDISTSPTLSIAATGAGFIIGTAAYMAPEQARGKSVDRRADIWSFGVVLYEMLTGKLAFQGETISDTLAGVIRAEPEWTALPANVPLSIRQLLQRCLRKDVRTRLQSIGDARITLDEFLANPAGSSSSSEFLTPAAIVAQPFWRRAIPWFAVASLALIAALAVWRPWQVVPDPGVIRLTADFGDEGSLYSDYGTAALLSPDGTRIVYVEKGAHGRRQLFVRSLDQMQGAPLAGTDGARNPFFSPDGQWLGFFTNDKLKKISLQGGATVTLCDIQDDRGGAWGEDGSIIMAPNTRAGLSRISASGGKLDDFSKLDDKELTHRWPQFLPGGKAVLFTSSTDGNNYDDSDIAVQVVATRQRKNIFHGGYYPRYLSSGHVVFIHEGTLYAASFDLQRLEFTGEPVPVLDQVVGNLSNGGGQFSASQTGLFTYLSGRGARERLEVDWLSADGKLTPLRKEPAAFWGISFSPDGKLLALGLEDGKRQDIWVDDWQRDTIRRLTFTGEENYYPAWTPDGRHISYASTGEGGKSSISLSRADGVGDAQPLLEGKFRYGPMSWRPDGKVLAFSQRNVNNEWNIMTVTLQGDEKNGWKAGEVKPFLNSTVALGLTPAFSPDGRWLAYASNESGVIQLYVRPFPGPGGKWQISTGGGVFPQWSADGREIFFRTDNDKIMVASYSVSEDSFRADTPRPWTDLTLADRGPNPNYALHPDGKRMAIFKDPSADPLNQITKITFVFNFLDEIRRKLAPAKP